MLEGWRMALTVGSTAVPSKFVEQSILEVNRMLHLAKLGIWAEYHGIPAMQEECSKFNFPDEDRPILHSALEELPADFWEQEPDHD